jgi:hypothetical protein
MWRGRHNKSREGLKNECGGGNEDQNIGRQGRKRE